MQNYCTFRAFQSHEQTSQAEKYWKKAAALQLILQKLSVKSFILSTWQVLDAANDSQGFGEFDSC